MDPPNQRPPALPGLRQCPVGQDLIMAWIESHQALKDHPKTEVLAYALDVRPAEAIGLLHCLWWWALDYAPNGDLSNFDPRVIAKAATWHSDPMVFVAALLNSGFLDDGPTIHDWMDYAGRLVETRRRKAEAMKQKRATNMPPRSGNVPLPTVPNRTQPTVPNQPTGPGERAPSEEVAAPAKSPRSRAASITEPFLEEMRQKWGPILGDVQACIDKALNHTASKKWIDKQQGLDNWLKRDAEEKKSSNFNNNQRKPGKTSRVEAHSDFESLERAWGLKE